jgi:parvulin-like peptidyl-prolyl isomerase
LVLGALLIGALSSFSWFRLAEGVAQVPATPATDSASTGDPGKRVVAYIYDKEPITREELGEYLIQRYGPEKLQLLVNKRIIEKACSAQGVEVSAAEVEAALDDDLKGMNVDRKGFVQQLISHYRTTLYEWKEDVIKPRLMLTKLLRNTIQVSEEDLQHEFECQHGEKVDCRAIIYPEKQRHNLMGELGRRLKNDEQAFEQAARDQPLPGLALTGGKIKPVSHFSGADNVERVAFSLRPGEVSELIETPQGLLILKCIQRIPAETQASLEKSREELKQTVLDKKLQKEIPNYFQKLREQAKPLVFMKARDTEKDLVEQAQKALKDTREAPGANPQGN